MSESKLIFPTEYSTLSTKALLDLIKIQYANIISSHNITFLKRGFNDTYLLSTKENSSTKFIFRVYKHNWRSLETIETELKLLNYLNANDVSVSYPIEDLQNNHIQKINAPEGIRYAVLFSFAEGRSIKKLSAEQAYLLGTQTGKIHHLLLNQNFGITANDYHIEKQFETALTILKPVLINHPEQYNYLQALYKEFLQVFNDTTKEQLQSGICHGDLQSENFHITDDNRFTFFDFDFFGTGYLTYDIGVFKWYDHKNKTPEIMNAFLKGYQTQHALSETEIKLIPYFSTLRALFQMTLYCKLSDGKLLPIWPAEQVAEFVKKINKWQEAHKLAL